MVKISDGSTYAVHVGQIVRKMFPVLYENGQLFIEGFSQDFLLKKGNEDR
jgi:hypothetical protein